MAYPGYVKIQLLHSNCYALFFKKSLLAVFFQKFGKQISKRNNYGVTTRVSGPKQSSTLSNEQNNKWALPPGALKGPFGPISTIFAIFALCRQMGVPTDFNP